MTRYFGLVAVLAFVGGATAEDKKADDKKEPAKFDASKLEGKWTITEIVKGGEKGDTKEYKDPVVFTKDTITMKSPAGDFGFKYTVDGKTDPAGVDMEITAPEGFKGAKAKGIVKLDGDKLMLAYDTDPEAKAAPKGFESKKDSKVFSYVLTRVKDDKKEK